MNTDMASLIASPGAGVRSPFVGKMAAELLDDSEDIENVPPTFDLGNAFEALLENCMNSVEGEVLWRRNTNSIRLKEIRQLEKETKTNPVEEPHRPNNGNISCESAKLDTTVPGQGDEHVNTVPENMENVDSRENEMCHVHNDNVSDKNDNESAEIQLEQTHETHFPVVIDNDEEEGILTRKCSKEIVAKDMATTKVATKKKKQKKIQGVNKKWRRLVGDVVKFDTSLLSFRRPQTEEVTFEMDRELEIFNRECIEEAGTMTCEACARSDGEETRAQNISIQVKTRESDGRNVFKYRDITFISLSHNKEFEMSRSVCDDESLEEKVHDKTLERLVMVSGTRGRNRLRMKNKWHTQKAHKQVKTKHCKQVGAPNGALGKKLYINCRLTSRMDFYCAGGLRMQLSMKAIDKARGFNREFKREIKETQRNNSPTTSARPGGYVRPVIPARDRGQPPRHRHAVNAYNADGALDADLVNLLIRMQDRDLTPEDYEMLLRLDERVAPKTVSEDIIANLKTEPVSGDMLGENCAVCMDEYSEGVVVKHLPCGHMFHIDCIDNWLKNSSVSCPLDGEEIS